MKHIATSLAAIGATAILAYSEASSSTVPAAMANPIGPVALTENGRDEPLSRHS
jgi:hypothetical protein